MRAPIGTGEPRQQPQGAANGNASQVSHAPPGAGANRTSSTTKAHLTNVRFDELNISANTKRCVPTCVLNMRMGHHLLSISCKETVASESNSCRCSGSSESVA
jgi:hypothetical protein